MKKTFLFYFLYCTIPSVQAIIIEHDRLDSLFQYIDTPNTLVVFDIDNTLATSEFEIGNDQWFSYLVQKKQQEGFDIEHAINLSLPTYFHVAFNVPLVPVEEATVQVVKQLHNQKIPTIALTARSIYIADRTQEQLDDIDIHLSIPQIQQTEIFLTLPTHIPSMYKDGILYSGNNDKGEVLLEFFKETNYYPMKVIFLDDKRKYLESLEKALEKKTIPFIGIRYSACDERVKNFNKEQAEREFTQFKMGLLPTKKSTSIFSYVCDWIHSLLQCIIPS